jgi:hypothetical protein
MNIQILLDFLDGIWLILGLMGYFAIKVFPIETTIAIIGILIAWIRPWKRRWLNRLNYKHLSK